ncbi:MAG: peptide deformylase [Spirochaetales bacterium]|nr:peptide deformylase [Spirochaetales bacterium]
MAVHKILRAGNPLLRQKSAPVPVEEIRSQENRKLIKDMFETMFAADGLGLAAPQIGILKQIVVVGFEQNERYPDARPIQKQVLINPLIEVMDAPREGYWEGCLSVPDMRGYVERSRKIRMTWYDEKENFHDEVIEGFDAVVYQHECDHLQGILYIDRLKSPELFGFNAELDAAGRERVAI